MGDVYEAESTAGARVALKLLRALPYDADELRARFEREATVASSLEHRNVVAVLEHGVSGDAPYFVMPLLRGEDLERCIERTGPMRPDVATAILCAAAEG